MGFKKIVKHVLVIGISIFFTLICLSSIISVVEGTPLFLFGWLLTFFVWIVASVLAIIIIVIIEHLIYKE